MVLVAHDHVDGRGDVSADTTENNDVVQNAALPTLKPQFTVNAQNGGENIQAAFTHLAHEVINGDAWEELLMLGAAKEWDRRNTCQVNMQNEKGDKSNSLWCVVS